MLNIQYFCYYIIFIVSIFSGIIFLISDFAYAFFSI